MNSPELDLEQLTAQIEALLVKREEMLYEQTGVRERYYVFNPKTGKTFDDAWVLSSASTTDRKILEDISKDKYYPEEWNQYIQDWLKEEDARHTDLDCVEDI